MSSRVEAPAEAAGVFPVCLRSKQELPYYQAHFMRMAERPSLELAVAT